MRWAWAKAWCLLAALLMGACGADALPVVYVDCDGGTHDAAPDFAGGNPGCGGGGQRGMR